MKKDLKKYEEDYRGWFYRTNNFGEIGNIYDLSKRSVILKGKYNTSKVYVKFK